MRRFVLLAALVLPLLVPTPVHAGTCPALEGGVVDRTSYRLGEIIDFYGTYHDFANPGTVTITLERTTDGAIREYTAFNSPDGSWYLMHRVVDPADVGRWAVTVVVSQTDALDSCTDVVTIRALSAPNTDVEPVTAFSTGGGGAITPVAFALLALSSGLLLLRRLGTPSR